MTLGVMPIGMPALVVESVVRFMSFTGSTKLSTTRFTEGEVEVLLRAMIQ